MKKERREAIRSDGKASELGHPKWAQDENSKNHQESFTSATEASSEFLMQVVAVRASGSEDQMTFPPVRQQQSNDKGGEQNLHSLQGIHTEEDAAQASKMGDNYPLNNLKTATAGVPSSVNQEEEKKGRRSSNLDILKVIAKRSRQQQQEQEHNLAWPRGVGKSNSNGVAVADNLRSIAPKVERGLRRSPAAMTEKAVAMVTIPLPPGATSQLLQEKELLEEHKAQRLSRRRGEEDDAICGSTCSQRRQVTTNVPQQPGAVKVRGLDYNGGSEFLSPTSFHSTTDTSRKAFPAANLNAADLLQVEVTEAQLVPESEQQRMEELREQIRAEVEQELLVGAAHAHASVIGFVLEEEEEEEDEIQLLAKEDAATLTTRQLGDFERTSLQELSQSRLLFHHQNIPLQGRQSEVEELTGIYNRVLHDEPKQEEQAKPPLPRMVLVGGSTGVGKSMLVKEGFLSSNSFFGKYDFQQRGQPYTGLVAAYNSICEHIVHRLAAATSGSSSDEESSVVLLADTICSELQQLLGNDDNDATPSSNANQLLCTMIPALKQLLIGDTAEASDNDASATTLTATRDPTALIDMAQHRLKFLFRQLTKILSRFFQSQPLVLILDDLQWADDPSLTLLSELAADNEDNPQLLIVATYRNDDAYTKVDTVFGSWLSIELTKATTTQMELGNLGVDGVQSMIQEILGNAATAGHASAATSQLAQIIHRKTLGNAFFVSQFVQNLYNQEILSFNLSTMLWTWDDKKVDEVEVTDNVAGILRAKLDRLDPTSQFVAQVGACLGSNFCFLLLLMGTKSLEVDVTTNAVSRGLQNLLNEGILERRSTSIKEEVHFAHDQIQQAAFDMIPQQKRLLWQALIGQAILNNFDSAGVERRLFLITDLINKGISLEIPEKQGKLLERDKIIGMNHRAGKKSMATSAYAAATSYLMIAISLLDKESCWEHDERARTLDIYCTVAESEYCNAKFDDMQRHIDIVLKCDEIPFDCKLRPYVVLITSLNARNKYIDAINLGVEVLDKLQGRKILPSKTSILQIIYELLITKKATSRKSFDELAYLPLLDDDKRVYADRILDTTLTATYIARPDLFPLLPLRSIQSCVRHGVGAYSPPSFAAYAVILCGKLGELREGYKQGRVAMAIQERLPHPRVCQSRTYMIFFGMVAHWVMAAATLIEKFEEGYRIGMSLGDLESAMIHKLCQVQFHWHCGMPLSRLIEVASKAKSETVKHRQDLSRDKVLPFWQFALNLMGQTKDPFVLTGDVMNENDFLNGSGDVKYSHSLVYGLRLQLAYLLGGGLSLLEEMYKKAKELPENLMGLVLHQRHLLYDGMVSFYLADKTKKRSKWLRRGKAAKKQVDKWVKEGNVNATHVSLLLSAELSFVLGKHDKAKGLYEQAIDVSHKNGYQQDCALAYERSGINCLRMGDESRASSHLTKAYKANLKWGAAAKADQLLQLHGDRIQSEMN